MKIVAFLIIFEFSSFQLMSQSYNSVLHSSTLSNCTATDFSKVDSFSCWFYVLSLKSASHEDSAKKIGELTFQRTHEVVDSASERLYKSGFLPNITFQIYDIKDSAYCFKISKLIRNISSCVAPDVGGDIIVFGRFIFLNLNVCLHCKRYDDKVDYCRPVINKIFLSVDKTKTNSLEQIVNQFPIEGQTMKTPF